MRTSICLLLVPGALCGAQSISIGPNVQVSKERPSLVHDELTITADPSNPNHLLACALVMRLDRYKPYDIAYASRDGGRTWSVGVDLKERSSGDVDCAYGPDGSAYFSAHVSGNKLNPPPDAWNYRSPDGGRTWLPPTIAKEVNDRQYIAIDHSTGRFRGRIYLSYRKNFYGIEGDQFVNSTSTGLGLQVSVDSGKTWQLTALRPAFPGIDKVHAYPTYTTVLSDGTLVIPMMFWQYPQGTDGRLMIFRSLDGGQTLLKATTATDIKAMPRAINVSAYLPYVAADPGSAAFKDRLYAAWADSHSGRYEIWFTSSADKGVTWTRPRVISDDMPRPDGTGPDDFNAALAVSKSGVVAVSWYDRRDNPDNVGWYVRFTASLDGGETWLPSVRVSEAPNMFEGKETWALASRNFYGDPTNPANLSVDLQQRTLYAGHTAGMAASADGAFYPLWVDNRTGVPQAWTARVTVPGMVALHGGGDLASLVDVSSKIALDMVSATHDAATGAVSVVVRLKNQSRDTVRGPIKVRALSVRSQVGALSAANADNRGTGSGAVWDFSPALTDGRLVPGDSSAERTLVFRVSQPRGFKQGNATRFGIIDMDAIILAGHAK